MRLRVLLAVGCLVCWQSVAQQISYFNQGFLRQPSALLDRVYLGVTQYVAGANVTLTYGGNNVYAINAGGGGGLIELTGDVLGGPGVSPLATTLKNTGTAGTYTKITFDAQGRETSGTSATLDSADFANQGTTTTLLHGNAAGNPSWGAVDLANDVSGNLGVTHLNSGTGAGATTFWCGDGTWATPTGSSPDIRPLDNTFTGTNTFSGKDVFITKDLQVGATGGGPDPSAVVRVRTGTGLAGAGANLTMVPSQLDLFGSGIYCQNDAGTYVPFDLRGSTVNIGYQGSGEVKFYQGTTVAGLFSQYSGLLLGYDNSVGQQFNVRGTLRATNIICGDNYIRAQKGMMVTSNSWSHSGNSSWVSGDSFGLGDNFYCSSNGVPYVIVNDAVGNITTNPVLYVLPPYVLTNQWSNGPVVLYTNLTVRDTMVATNGILVLMSNSSSVASIAVTTNLHFYCLNGTNQLVTLPNAANVPQRLFRFSSTNAFGIFIVTNATGAQTIRNGIGLAYTNIGVGEVGLVSDGGHWWLASKGKTIFPAAQFSCSTNIALTSAGVAYPVTFNSVDFNFSQGISLQLGTNGLHSKMRITNPGIYEFGPSIVESFTGNHIIRYWFRSNGVNVANSSTSIKAQNNDVHVVTVPFVISVAQQSDFEIWAMSSVGNDSLVFEAAGGVAPDNYPLSPSVICPVKRISDPWP